MYHASLWVAVMQHDREKMTELKSMLNDGYNNMSNMR